MQKTLGITHSTYCNAAAGHGNIVYKLPQSGMRLAVDGHVGREKPQLSMTRHILESVCIGTPQCDTAQYKLDTVRRGTGMLQHHVGLLHLAYL